MSRRSVLAGAGAASPVGLPAVRSARAETLDEIKQRGTLVIGLEAAYVCYVFFRTAKSSVMTVISRT
jgi:hypothetical protein